MTNSSEILAESVIGSSLRAKIQNRVITDQGSPRISVLLGHQLEILDASPVGRVLSA